MIDLRLTEAELITLSNAVHYLSTAIAEGIYPFLVGKEELRLISTTADKLHDAYEAAGHGHDMLPIKD